jgi:diadenosine tetraphosphate (Ap4A) HIT family hydrolase
MTTLFTRIIDGELPARFVWRDDRAVAFLPIAPLCPGHTLVVPIEPVDHWIDLDDDLNAHLWTVAKSIGRALDEAFRPTKLGVIVQGVEVPHAHVHLVPYTDLSQMTFASQDPDPDPGEMDRQAELIRATLRAHGHGAVVPG